jgi:hypothetical protein
MSPPPRDVHILELEGNQIHISIYEYSEEFKPIEDPKIAIRWHGEETLTKEERYQKV